MKFENKHSFSKPSDAVIRMFSDRAYFERKYKELGFTAIQVLEHEKSDSKFRIKVCYTAKNTVAIPEFAKKFIPDTAIVTQSDTWDLTDLDKQLGTYFADRDPAKGFAADSVMTIADQPLG